MCTFLICLFTHYVQGVCVCIVKHYKFYEFHVEYNFCSSGSCKVASNMYCSNTTTLQISDVLKD